MDSLTKHIHISGINGVIVALYVIIVLGVFHILARRFEGHPLADAFMSVYC